MHFSLLMEDYLEFDDWHDRENEEINFNDSSSDERLMSNLKSTDHYFRKQGFTDIFLFLQHNTNTDVFPSIFDALQKFSSEEESTLRCDFAESLITITKLTISKSLTKWSCVENFTIPSVINLLHDTNKQIRLASHATIIYLIENKLVNKELFLEALFPTLEELMVSYNPDELRTECFTLLVQISDLLDHCLEDKLLFFCRDFISTNDNLRKTCASYLLNIINGSSDIHLDDWLEIFYKLSDDNSWYVKKFCIECAVSLSKKVSHLERSTKMSNVYYNFMTDSKKWVVTCAYQHFGAFVATFANPSKAYCEISNDGKVVNVRIPPVAYNADNPGTTQTKEPPLSSDSESSFSNIFFWQQPIDSSFLPSTSPESISIKDIDINQSDSSDLYNWPPDLSKYKQEIIPANLLQCYSNTIHEICETDLIRQCAFSMPAVLATLGPCCWPYLKTPYLKLVQFMSWKVRLSLASSLHHVFRIFKYNNIAIKDLIWTYKELIKDVDEVKIGVMANVSEFYLVVPMEMYSLIFEDFDDFVHLDNIKNWRYRVNCMEQLEALISQINLNSQDHKTIFLDMVIRRWMPVISVFCEEHVWAVRIAAANAIIATLKKVMSICCDTDGDNNNDECESVIKDIQGRLLSYSESRTWYMRQIFLNCVVKVILTDSMTTATLDSIIMPRYLDLCGVDGVPNNRMVGGQGLAQICSHGYFKCCSSDIKQSMETVYLQLRADKDRDVRESVEKLDVIFVTITP